MAQKENQVFPICWVFLLSGIISICLAILFAVSYTINNKTDLKPFGLDLREYTTVNVDTLCEYSWSIDSVCVENEKLIVTGWVVPQDSDLTYANRVILLTDDSGVFWSINTIAYDREIPELNDSDHLYSLGGVMGQVSISELDMNKKYKLFIYMIENDGQEILFDPNLQVSLPDLI